MLKKSLSFWIMSGILLLTPGFAVADSSPRGPRAFLPESVYEFAPVVEGSPVEHEFILYNRGDETLHIIKIDSG